MPAEARTYGDGSSEMRVLLPTYESRGDVESMVGLAVRLRALGAEMPVCAPPDKDFAELLARVGALLVPVGQPVRPMVHGATPPSSSGAPARTSPARAQAVCTHAPSKSSISVESPIGSFCRGRWLRSWGSPGSPWTSATFPPGTTTGWGCGRTASSAYWPAGSASWRCRSIADGR